MIPIATQQKTKETTPTEPKMSESDFNCSLVTGW